MSRMRGEGVYDASIGRILDISRQRVEQIMGARNDPRLHEDPAIISRVTELYLAGKKRREIAEDFILVPFGVNEVVVGNVVKRLSNKVKHEARKYRSEARVLSQLADFFNGRKFARSVDLMEYDQYLYNSSRIKPFEEWCMIFNVKYEYRTRRKQ